ncbi:MAG: 3-oxoacyl-ACP reductase FabG [Thermaerobacter sp.]|nr:3-oxoacyl-ACP reductase FabG [Thermaerobacter sp.]
MTSQLLRGQVALVTGAGRGLGRAIAVQLAAHGAAVAVNDIAENNALATAAAIHQQAGQAAVYPGSVTDSSQIESMVQTIQRDLGAVSILVNNAGINRDRQLVKMSDQEWSSVLDVDLTGPFYVTRAVLPAMIAAQYGRIINISSASWQGNFGQANYAAAKAGLIGLTKTATREVAKHGITVNAICPGFIETEMTRGVPPKVWDLMVSKIPAGRVGQPDDVAKVVVFLASDYAAYVNGEVISVGGGMVL